MEQVSKDAFPNKLTDLVGSENERKWARWRDRRN